MVPSSYNVRVELDQGTSVVYAILELCKHAVSYEDVVNGMKQEYEIGEEEEAFIAQTLEELVCVGLIKAL